MSIRSHSRSWLRTAGYIGIAIFTSVVFLLSYVIIAITVLRRPTHLFPPLAPRDWLIVSLWLLLALATGVAAILAARKFKNGYRVLYIPGTIAVLWAIGFVPLQRLASADYAMMHDIPDPAFLIDTWRSRDARLTLSSDSSFVLAEYGLATSGDDTLWHTGTWRVMAGKVVLSPLQEEYTLQWPVLESDCRHFIAHRLPANLEDWDGNLGLLREKEWQLFSSGL